MEIKARKNKRVNTLIKGIEVEEERRREAIKELFRILEVKVDIKEIKELG